MNRHLSSGEISSCILDEPTPQIEQHLEGCADCRAELAAFKITLSLFGESAHNWAGRQLPSEAQTMRRIQQLPYRGILQSMCLALAMTVLCVFGFASVRQHSSIVTPAAADPDLVLLERVNAQTAQTVPSSLAPLDVALSWETTSRDAARR